MALKSRETLTTKEIEEIKLAHIDDTVPEEMMFDGKHYIDWEGNSSLYHPRMGQFVDEYIAAKNIEIEKHNTQI